MVAEDQPDGVLAIQATRDWTGMVDPGSHSGDPLLSAQDIQVVWPRPQRWGRGGEGRRGGEGCFIHAGVSQLRG